MRETAAPCLFFCCSEKLRRRRLERSLTAAGFGVGCTAKPGESSTAIVRLLPAAFGSSRCPRVKFGGSALAMQTNVMLLRLQNASFRFGQKIYSLVAKVLLQHWFALFQIETRILPKNVFSIFKFNFFAQKEMVYISELSASVVKSGLTSESQSPSLHSTIKSLRFEGVQWQRFISCCSSNLAL
jgi:hypothetical protein